MGAVGDRVLILKNTPCSESMLKLRLGVTKLTRGARARGAESEAAEAPSSLLDTARMNVIYCCVKLPGVRGERSQLDNLLGELQSFVELTADLRRYSLQGFDKFKGVDKELDALLARTNDAQMEVVRLSKQSQSEAARAIRTWSVIALLVGALVAAGTIWESQRRFGEMRRSVDEARRERTFTGQLMEGMVSAVAAIDENDRIRSANAAFFRIFPRATIGA